MLLSTVTNHLSLSLSLLFLEPGHTGLHTRRPVDPLAARTAAVSADALLRSQAA